MVTQAGDTRAGGTQVAGTPRRAYLVVLAIATLFILYGSLYPFEYRERSYPGGAVGYLLSTWQDWDGRGDLLSNILLYIPFGFFATCALPARIPGWLRAGIAAAAGTLLSVGVELTQFHDQERITSLGDVYANAVGTAAGSLAAALAGASLRWPFAAQLAAHPRPTMLLALWAGYRFYPYVPTIDLHKYWHAVQPLLLAPELPPDVLFRFTVVWSFIASLVESLYGLRRWLLLFPLLAAAEFLGRVLILSTDLEPADLVGAVAAFALWLALRQLPGRFVVLVFALVAVIVMLRLAPFDFAPTGRGFGWVPFHSMMSGSIGVAMQAFCEKSYLYGGLIWLLYRTGLRLGPAATLTALLLLGTSYAELYLPDRSAETTDAVMALVIGGVFRLFPSSASRRPATSAAVARPRWAGPEHGELL